MMKFEAVKNLEDEKFRRLTGVKRSTANNLHGICQWEKTRLPIIQRVEYSNSFNHKRVDR